MAWAQYALSSFPPSSSNNSIIITRRTLASVSPSSPSKFTKRKNYLRPKLLKTLTKPNPIPNLPRETLENPSSRSETLVITQNQELEIAFDRSIGEISGDIVGEEESYEQKELESRDECVSDSTGAGVSDAVGVVSSRSVLELALYMLGLFIFQTICAAWVFGSVLDKKSGNEEGEVELEVIGSEIVNERKNGDSLLDRSGEAFGEFFASKPGVVVLGDNSQYEEQIIEIRAMAREARESEAKKARANDLVPSSNDVGVSNDEVAAETVNSSAKTGIQNEVHGRLTRLQKKLRSLREKSPMSSVSFLSNLDETNDKKDSESSDANGKAGTLTFKKKHKFSGSPTNPGNNPKGFQSLKDDSISKDNSRKTGRKSSLRSRTSPKKDLDLSVQEQELDLLPNGDAQESNSITEEGESYLLNDEQLGTSLTKVQKNEEAGRKSLSKELNSFQACDRKSGKEVVSSKRGMAMGVKDTEPKGGGIQESSHERPLNNSVEPRKSFRKENLDSSTTSYKQAALSMNGSSRQLLQTREVEKKPIVNKDGDKRSDMKSDLWWLNLPYALAILLRRGPGREGPRGLYTLKINSSARDESYLSYTVAFEDRSDATNFCYLLESFFNDLNDFSADVIPLSIKELDKAVKSSTMKVIVVRKGQLRLYAGQPLVDVEMALRSFVQ
ncbi:hypothetical protein HHK36_020786 [Tetracentron sinense]|uniref:Uncharacterized protein n=1 Tax=Tetracentron sinense TaxID=13715 RepID=A0A835D8P4_TETSI|nr:hypothetical protein HHK36_020786 [Tetracentron sinense]